MQEIELNNVVSEINKLKFTVAELNNEIKLKDDAYQHEIEKLINKIKLKDYTYHH